VAPEEERTPLLETLIAPVRRYGVRAFLLALSILGIIATFLSASGIILPPWEYVAITAGLFVGVLTVLILSSPRYKFWLFSLVFRRPVRRDPVDRPYRMNLRGAQPRAPVLQVAAGRKVDRTYEAGLRALLTSTNPVAIHAAPARDVSRKERLPAGMWGAGGTRTESVVDPQAFGIPLAEYRFERHYTAAADDTEHSIAIRDLIFLPHLAVALRAAGFDATRPADPFMWPEHCVDIQFLAAHDLVVVSGGDTNFWHGAIFEPIYRAFTDPKSTVPLACDMRDPTGELSFYGSASINLNVHNRHLIPGLEKARRHELDERRFPTSAMILAVDNPFARALGRDHWCAFVAGPRSLGTSGAVLGLAAALEQMRADPSLNYTTLVDTEDPDVTAAVSALLVRTVKCEFAADDYTGVFRARGINDIPTDRPDPDYRDSYVPVGVEYLDNHGEIPIWRPLVTLEPHEATVDKGAVGLELAHA
jgi:hypothetical protein